MDGAEIDVLRGAGTTLLNPPVKTVLADAQAELGDQVIQQLEIGGLTLTERHDRGRESVTH